MVPKLHVPIENTPTIKERIMLKLSVPRTEFIEHHQPCEEAMLRDGFLESYKAVPRDFRGLYPNPLPSRAYKKLLVAEATQIAV